MDNLRRLLREHHYKMTKESSKSTEFQNTRTREIIYLLPNKELTLVLSPRVVEGNESLKSKSKIVHNTSFRHYPKKKNKGETEISYGYSFRFESEEQLALFISKLVI